MSPKSISFISAWFGRNVRCRRRCVLRKRMLQYSVQLKRKSRPSRPLEAESGVWWPVN